MDKDRVKKAIEELKKHPKRKFNQSYDLVINLKNFEVKSNPLDFFVTLPHPKGRAIKVACFCDQLLIDEAKKTCDLVITESDFDKYKEKSAAKKLAEGYDYFIAQANLMPKVATTFGKVLGVKGKMPNPKLGCVVPPNANLDPLVKKLGLTVRLQAKKATNLQCIVGKEDQADEEVIANIMAVFNAALKNVPNETQNIKDSALKLTMSKPVKI
jgi:large subunit ribosomal protein L1